MPSIIKSISIKDFRSFEKETISLKDITCIIGPNEGGKTNLLDAINMLIPGDEENEKDKRVLRHPDIRKNSLRFREGKLPEFEFNLTDQIVKDERLRKVFSIRKGKTVNLLREGNNSNIQLGPKVPAESVILQNLSNEAVVIDKEGLKFSLDPNQWAFMKKNKFELIKPEIDSFISANKLEIAEEAGMAEYLKELLWLEIMRNLNIFFWGYDQKYSLPGILDIKEFLKDPQEKLAVLSIFRLAGYEEDQLPAIFENKNETDVENVFNQISEKVTREIRKAWPPNPNIELKIVHKIDHLLINISEPGYQIEPEYRSEGLRWFLAFLIGLLSKAKVLKDYILLIDEPALYLHPGGQKAVLAKINDLGFDNQIIYSTHSPFMVDKRFPGRVLFLFKDIGEGYSLSRVEEPKIDNILRDPLLRETLGYSITDLSYLSQQNILFEGYFDKKIFELLVEGFIKENRAQETIDINNTGLIDCTGAGEIARHARLYKSSKLRCISIYDSDGSGSQAQKANIERSIQGEDEIINISDVSKRLMSMEDLIPEEIFISSVRTGLKTKKPEKIKRLVKIPRSQRINAFINEKTEHIDSTDERREIRKSMKRGLEDCIIKKVSKHLNRKGLEGLDKLVKLHSRVKRYLEKSLSKTI